MASVCLGSQLKSSQVKGRLSWNKRGNKLDLRPRQRGDERVNIMSP